MHVLIALQNQSYPWDRRVRQQAEALVAEGHDVTLCSPTGERCTATEEWTGGVRVLRHPSPPTGKGIVSYLPEEAVSMFRISKLIWKVPRERKVAIVHACTPPDLLILPALP